MPLQRKKREAPVGPTVKGKLPGKKKKRLK